MRGLLITVLGDYVRPARQPAPTSAFIDALGRLGVEEDACRQALIRASKKRLADPPACRAVHLVAALPGVRAGPQLRRLADPRIHRHPAALDRRWLVVIARVPESNRAGRHLLYTRMRWAAFGRPSPGVWISTHTDRVQEAEMVLREAGAHEQAQIFLSEYIAGGDLRTVVRQAWDPDELEQRYQRFIDEFSRAPSDGPIVRVTRMVHAWRLLALVDPALPEELLPKNWSGIRAAKLFHRQHAKWEPAAIRE